MSDLNERAREVATAVLMSEDINKTWSEVFTNAVYEALLSIDREAREDERRETARVLQVAQDAILWWQNEHTCCAGATDEALEQIAAAIRARKE